MSRTILLVDDDREVQRYLADLFEAEGWRVIAEKDGDWALRAFEQRPVDAVVLDILIPVVNGFQVAEQIRAHPRGADIPIVMLTGIYRGAAHRAEAVRRYQLLDYLDKPVEGQRLLDRLREVFGDRPEAALFAGLAPPPAADPEEGPLEDTERDAKMPPENGAMAAPIPVGEALSAPPSERRRGAGGRSDELADDVQRREKREVERAARQIEDAGVALLRGNLRRIAFPRLLHRLYRRRAGGALFLLRNKVKKIIYFKEGHPTYIKSNLLSECLGRVLVRERLISESECEESLRKMKQEKRQQGAILIGMGVISPHNLKYGLELQMQVKLFDIFSWLEAEYQFREDVKLPNDVISLELSNAQIILEGIRRSFARVRIEAQLAPSLSSYVRPAADPALRFQEMGLEEDEAALLQSIDGSRTLRECLANAPMPEGRALAAAYAMLCAGVIETDEAPLRRPIPSARASLATPTPTEDRAERPDGVSRERLAASLLTLRGQDHFGALGLTSGSGAAALERAFERNARRYHPDRFRDRGADTRKIALEIFGRLTEAYQTLADPDARRAYLEELRSRGAPEPADPAGRALAADRYFRTGEELLRQRRFEEASEALRRAADLSPESAEYHAYLGWTVFQKDASAEDEAIAELERATRLNPKLDRAYLFLGFIHRDGGRAKQAESHFEKALQCNPDCEDALRELRVLQARRA